MTIIMALAIAMSLGASLTNGQEIPMVGNCTDSNTLHIYQNIYDGSVWNNITVDYIYCPYGCIENASQYGDDCKIPEIERTDSGMSTAGLIALAIIMFAMFYIAMSIGEGNKGEYRPLQWLLFGIGIILGMGVLNSAQILTSNAGQDILAGHLETIYGGYVLVSIFIGFYFGYLFFKWLTERMNPKEEEEE